MLGGFGGAVGGMLVSTVTGWLLERTGNYAPLFVFPGCAYLGALLLVHLLAPALKAGALSREDELAIRAGLAEAALLQDDLTQAAMILGRTPADPLTRWLLGSTSEAVLTGVPASVMLVPVEKPAAADG